MEGQVHTIVVERNRYSVTQGSVNVKFDGIVFATYEDDIKLIGSDDSWCGACGRPTYGENIGGWASINPDEYYIAKMFDDDWHFSDMTTIADRVKALLEKARKEVAEAWA